MTHVRVVLYLETLLLHQLPFSRANRDMYQIRSDTGVSDNFAQLNYYLTCKPLNLSPLLRVQLLKTHKNNFTCKQTSNSKLVLPVTCMWCHVRRCETVAQRHSALSAFDPFHSGIHFIIWAAVLKSVRDCCILKMQHAKIKICENQTCVGNIFFKRRVYINSPINHYTWWLFLSEA